MTDRDRESSPGRLANDAQEESIEEAAARGLAGLRKARDYAVEQARKADGAVVWVRDGWIVRYYPARGYEERVEPLVVDDDVAKLLGSKPEAD